MVHFRGLILRSHRETCGIQHLRPRQLSGNSTTIGSRTKVGILGDLNSSDFSFRDAFSLDGKWIPWHSTECRQIHLPHATFSHVQSLHRSHCTDDLCAWLKFELRHQNIHSSTRHVSPCASQCTEHQHKFSLTNLSCVLSSSSPNTEMLSTHPFIHCEDPRQDGAATEFDSSTWNSHRWTKHTQRGCQGTQKDARTREAPREKERAAQALVPWNSNRHAVMGATLAALAGQGRGFWTHRGFPHFHSWFSPLCLPRPFVCLETSRSVRCPRVCTLLLCPSVINAVPGRVGTAPPTLFLTCPTSTSQRAYTLRRSTVTSQWRFGWVPTPYRLWAQASCWRPWLQALHRRRSVHWTQGFTCQTLVLPPVDHSVNLWLSGKHRDASGIGLRRRTTEFWVHHCTYRSEKQVQNDRKFVTLNEKTLCPVHLKIRSVQGNLSHCFQAKIGWIKTQFPIERIVLEDINRFLGAVNLSSDSLTRQMLRNLLLLETEIMCLLKRDLNSWSRNTKWESLTTCICEFQQQTYVQRLELEDAHLGHVESRREQVRQQEELVMKEKALRGTQIRSIHEMGEMKRAQELRVVQKIERKSWHDTAAHFTNTRVAREGALHEWFRRISRYRIELQWKFFSRSQSTSSRSKSSIYVESRPKHAIRYMEIVWNTGKRVWQSTSNVRLITDTLSRNSSLNESECQWFDPSAGKYRATCRKRWRTNWEHNTNADDCKKAVNHECILTSGSTTEFYGCTAKTADIGASVR